MAVAVPKRGTFSATCAGTEIVTGSGKSGIAPVVHSSVAVSVPV